MHVPNKFKETNVDVLHDLVQSHPLGAWIVSKDDELEVNHLPFALDKTQGEFGVLKGHVSIANPVWKSLPTTKESIVVFQGAEAYITPSWYPSKQEHGKAVPTWNYVVVHAHGQPKAITDKDWLLEHLNTLTDQQESDQAKPWKVADAPASFTEKVLNAIVGIEIPISALNGAWKTSQNKTPADKAGVIDGLRSDEKTHSAEMASYVSQHR